MLKGWKTLGIAAFFALFGTLEAFDWTQVVPDNLEPFLVPLIAIIFGYLRTITTTAWGKGE